jgi:carbon storage regulator CsrA
MSAHPLQIDNLNDLRAYVHFTICEQNELQIGAFQVTERILVRGRNPCGVFFCLHGPRSVKLTAIWETDRNTILFYSSTGERVGKTQLVHAPILEPALV